MQGTSGEEPGALSGQGDTGRDFGVHLRQLRTERGWSLADLAIRSNYSKSHLSNVERGTRLATHAVAAACEKALSVQDELAERVPADPLPRADSIIDCADLLTAYTAVLSNLRALGRVAGPELILGMLGAATKTLRSAVVRARGPDSDSVWLLAARFAEYAGWIEQEAGNVAASLRWTKLAGAWAEQAGERDMAGYVWIRYSLIAQHRGNAEAAISHAKRAAASDTAAPIRALAAHREAHGHAMAGDYSECLRALDLSRELLAASTGHSAAESSWGPWTSTDASPLVTASCLVSLGRHEEALAFLPADMELVVPAAAHGSAHLRFVIRQATAHAGVGETVTASELALRILPAAVRLNSSTVHRELARLASVVSRHGKSRDGQELLAHLHPMLRAR